MSKEQIDRILMADFSIIDNTIDAKINSIDQITGKLTEKSNFLAQFQLLLQNQLGNISAVKTSTKQTICNVPVQHLAEAEPQQIRQVELIEEQTQIKDECFQIYQHNYPEVKQDSFLQQRFIKFEIVDRMSHQVNELKVLFYYLKEEIKNQIQFMKSITVEAVLNLIKDFQAEQQSKYKRIQTEQQLAYLNKINQLQLQIAFLKQKSRNLIDESLNPLKQLTFQKNNEDKQGCLNITKRFKQYQDHSNKYNSPAPKNAEYILNSEEWKTYRFKFDQHLQNQESNLHSKHTQNQSYVIPNLKNISVGVPPIKNGFGVLKSANQVIYRGMWKNGKFNGSGKLNWDGYCYEGNFENGSFQGHGKLQIKNMVYVGKFKDNKLWGEGTLEVGGKRIVGVWQKNKLIRMF